MVDWWWSLVGAAVPAVVASQALRMKKRRAEEQRLKSARGREKSSDDIFVCERVCTSKRMLKKVGAFSKDPTPDTCVTVCGVSELDACADACARTVCVNQHQVPNWNDICLKRCQTYSAQPITRYISQMSQLDSSPFSPIQDPNHKGFFLGLPRFLVPVCAARGVAFPAETFAKRSTIWTGAAATAAPATPPLGAAMPGDGVTSSTTGGTTGAAAVPVPAVGNIGGIQF
ncbi:hypothetical protein RJ640_023507 [Escallonia rubra]|uniref:Uncharacterized protein n=1 Tax=Escallonia rubra TaxID=112253 RepID=A0AA88UB12_9ASTE|nr:hypothetical protein RJ640_023507 [Escallonia rubra]